MTGFMPAMLAELARSYTQMTSLWAPAPSTMRSEVTNRSVSGLRARRVVTFSRQGRYSKHLNGSARGRSQ